MNLVRQHILEILKEHRCATVAELAQRLDMAPVSVRHHLDILQGDNLIRVERLARTGTVGRPKQLYALTPSANAYFPDNAAALASGLLRQLRNVLPPEGFNRALDALARDLSSQVPAFSPSTPLTKERLDQVVSFLNERGYLARWEKESNHTKPTGNSSANGTEESPVTEAYLVHKCNCPYSDVTTEHHELCDMDLVMMEHLLGQTCERIQSMTDNAAYCTYRISLPVADTPQSIPESAQTI